MTGRSLDTAGADWVLAIDLGSTAELLAARGPGAPDRPVLAGWPPQGVVTADAIAGLLAALPRRPGEVRFVQPHWLPPADLATLMAAAHAAGVTHVRAVPTALAVARVHPGVPTLGVVRVGGAWEAGIVGDGVLRASVGDASFQGEPPAGFDRLVSDHVWELVPEAVLESIVHHSASGWADVDARVLANVRAQRRERPGGPLSVPVTGALLVAVPAADIYEILLPAVAAAALGVRSLLSEPAPRPPLALVGDPLPPSLAAELLALFSAPLAGASAPLEAVLAEPLPAGPLPAGPLPASAWPPAGESGPVLAEQSRSS